MKSNWWEIYLTDIYSLLYDYDRGQRICGCCRPHLLQIWLNLHFGKNVQLPLLYLKHGFWLLVNCSAVSCLARKCSAFSDGDWFCVKVLTTLFCDMHISHSSLSITPQEEDRFLDFFNLNCLSYCTHVKAEGALYEASLISRRYLSNSWALPGCFSIIIHVKMIKADVHKLILYIDFPL